MAQQLSEKTAPQPNKKINDNSNIAVNNPLDEVKKRTPGSLRQELTRLILKAAGAPVEPDYTIMPGKDFVSTQQEYEKISAQGTKRIIVSEKEKDILKNIFSKNEKHTDKTKIENEDLKKIISIKDLNLTSDFKILGYINPSAKYNNVPVIFQQITLLNPKTGENLFIALDKNNSEAKLDIHKNFGFANFKNYEKEVLNSILKGSDNNIKIPDGTIENAKLVFIKAANEQQYDTIKLNISGLGEQKNKSISLNIFFIKGTTFIVDIKNDYPELPAIKKQ